MDTRQLPFDLMAAITEGDWVTLEAMCAEDMRSEWLDSHKLKGRASFLQFYRTDRKQYSDFHAEVQEVLVCDDTSVCFKGRVGGKQTGPIVTQHAEYPSTGRTFEVGFLCLIQTTDGQISQITYGLNFMAIWSQLGHMPTP